MTPLHLATPNAHNDKTAITAFVQFQYGYFISNVAAYKGFWPTHKKALSKRLSRYPSIIVVNENRAFFLLAKLIFRNTKAGGDISVNLLKHFAVGPIKGGRCHSASLSTESLTRFSDKLSSTPLLKKALRILSITDFEGRLALRSKSLIVDMLTPDAVTRSSCDISSSSLAALHTLAVNMGSIYSDLAIRSTKKSYFIFDNTPETSYLKYNKRGPKGSPKLYLEPHNHNNWRS